MDTTSSMLDMRLAEISAGGGTLGVAEAVYRQFAAFGRKDGE